MGRQSATYYDAIYAARGKDYHQEAQRLMQLIQQHKRSPGTALLDVACGSGSHLVHLHEAFQVEGLDRDPASLELARRRLPGVVFHQADMVDFELGRQYDVVTCLFSSIGYVRSVERLNAAIQTLRRHTIPGGLLLVEPWFSLGGYCEGKVHATFVDQGDLKLARMNRSEIVDGTISVLHFHYLVGTPEGVEHFTERHELGLFTHAEYMAAFEHCGMETIHDVDGLEGRGLYIGLSPLP